VLFFHHLLNALLDFLSPSFALPASVDASGHARYHGYKVINP
jgi:hypothetical protein